MEGQVEAPTEAPPDFSSMTPAQIRLWKRRQKMLKSGCVISTASTTAKRMAMVGGGSHVAGETKGTEVTKESKSEPAAQQGAISTKDQPSESTASVNKETPGVVEKAAWEKKWKKAAEKATKDETTTMPDIPSFTLPEEGENPSLLRKRKEEAEDKKGAAAADETKEESKNMKHLRQELAKSRNQQLFSVMRTCLVVLLAVALVLWHVSYGPFTDASIVEAKPFSIDSNLFDDNEDGEIIVELADEAVEAEVVESIPSIQIFTVEPPFEGWLSVPLLLLCVHVLLHQVFRLVCPLSAPALVNPSSGMAAMAEASMQGSPTKHLLIIPKLLATVVEDTTLFIFVFALAAAASTVAQ